MRTPSLTRRTVLALGAISLAPLGLGGAPALAQMSEVVIGTAKDPNLGAQIMVAKETGLFEAEGLEASVRYFPSGGDLLAAVVGGDVHYGSSGSTPITTLRARPFPIQIIAQISDISGAQQLIVKPEIETVADLAGKKVGLLPGTASELLFDSFSDAFGFDQSQVEIVSMGPTEMVTSFARGDVQAVNLWEPHTTRARQAGNGHVLVSGTHSYVPGMEGDRRIYGDHAALFAHESVISENPETTRAVLRALYAAGQFIEDDPERAGEILAKELGFEEEETREMMAVNEYTLRLDDTLVQDMNSLAEFLASIDKIGAAEDVRDWINPDPLRDVAPDLVQLSQ